MKTSFLFVFYMIMIVSYIANTTQLVLLASKHFKKNEKSFMQNRRKARIQNPMKAVTVTHFDHQNEPGTADGSTYLENRLIRLKESSLDNLIHDTDKTLASYRTRRGKKRMRKVRYFRYGTITLASKQPATLYRNGKRLLDIKRTYGGYRFTRNMKVYFGDLFAVESERTTRQYGVAIDLRLKVKQNKGRRIWYVHHNTQYEDDPRIWRGDGIPRKRWMTKRKQYCKLPKPTKVGNAEVLKPRVKNAPPLDPKTRYVWVSDGKASRGKIRNDHMVVPKTAYLILEIGVKCSRGLQYRRTPPRTNGLQSRNQRGKNRRPGRSSRKPEKSRKQERAVATQPKGRTQSRRKPRKTEARRTQRQRSPQRTKPRPSTPSVGPKPKPETRKREDTYPPQCKCRSYPRSKGSVCYRMLKPDEPHGRCRRRQCGVSYQCIPGGGRGLRNCIRHVANYEVVPLKNFKGVLRCSYRKLREPRVYYTLYE